MSTSGNANARQVAGNHYGNDRFPHWDLAAHLRLGYFEGNISKYITRHAKKNGMEDVEKALHYMEKLMEGVKKHAPWYAPWRKVKRQGHRASWPLLQMYFSANDLGTNEEAALAYLFNWNDIEDLRTSYRAILRIKHEYDVKAARARHKPEFPSYPRLQPLDEEPEDTFVRGLTVADLDIDSLKRGVNGLSQDDLPPAFKDTAMEFMDTRDPYEEEERKPDPKRTLDDPPYGDVLRYAFDPQPPRSGGDKG